MSCHFQVSIEQNSEIQAKRAEFCVFRLRLRKDGHQWQPQALEIDSFNPSGTAYLVDLQPVETIERFDVEGPLDLPEEDPMAQLGWFLVHCKPFAAEFSAAGANDRISVQGQELNAPNLKQLLSMAKTMTTPLLERLALNQKTPHPRQTKRRPRL